MRLAERGSFSVMTKKSHSRAFAAVGALSLASAMWGCVADRPSRNGVFNENQYIRKDFLVRPGDSETPDQGWFVKATITTASEPNVFGDAGMFGLYPGSHNNGALVHFVITNDKMQMVNSREISAQTGASTTGREPEVINAWAGTNVDLKYPGQSRRREDQLLPGEPGARLAAASVDQGQPRQERHERPRAARDLLQRRRRQVR